MKTVFKILLVIAIIGLGYVSVQSIMGPIQFNKEKERREKLIVSRLMDIRKAQIAYKSAFHEHAATFQELTDWLSSGRIPAIKKLGELSEKQLEGGMTEQKAVQIIARARATGNWKEAEEAGLSKVVNGQRESFTRDTTWVNAKENLFGNDFDLSTFSIVPGTESAFLMDTASIESASGFNIKIFQAAVPYEVYLGDLNGHHLRNLIDFAEKADRYPGLKVGSLVEVNNYAGNWE